MRGWVALIAMLAGASPALADWQRMTGAEISAALSEVRLEYDRASQVFYASGRTLYDSGRPSWGYWEVRGDQFCSQWPPADGWACYDMDRETDTGALRFVGTSGDVTEGVIAD